MSGAPVIVYRLGSLGDTIAALPCFHKIAERFPDRRRLVLTNHPVSAKAAPLQDVLGTGGVIHGTISYPVGTRSPAALFATMRELRAHRADTLVYLAAARGLRSAYRDMLFFRACGIRSIVGTPLSADLQRNRQHPETGEVEPECARLARCLAPLGPIDLDRAAAWDLGLTDAERRAGRAVAAPLAGARVIAINMGGKAAQKDWGVPNWTALLARLAMAVPDHGLLIVGAGEDGARAEAMGASWPGPVVNGCGRLGARQSAAAMEGAALFIGHDSGPLHLASAVGVPCVGLFGDFNRPRMWHPYFGRNHIIHDMRGMGAIPVDAVEAAALGLVAATAGLRAAV